MNILKSLIEQSNKSMRSIAHDLKIAPSTLSMYASNKREPSLDMLITLANYFNVTVDYLLGKEKSADIPSTDSRELTPDEIRLLEIFDKVDEEKKRHLLSLVEAAVSLQK